MGSRHARAACPQSLLGNGMKLRIWSGASTSPLRGYAQHERSFSARPEHSVAKSKDERATNFMPLPYWGAGIPENSPLACSLTSWIRAFAGMTFPGLSTIPVPAEYW